MTQEEKEIQFVNNLLNNCEELKALFVPTEDYPNWESALSASADWALDNHEVEELPIWESMMIEMLYYKMTVLCEVPVEDIDAIYNVHFKNVKYSEQ